MKIHLLTAGALLSLSSLVVAAESPVRIQLQQSVNPYTHLQGQKIFIQSTVENLVLNDVIVNRGNCKVYEKLLSHPVFPVTLTYGKRVFVTPQGNCQILEITVSTSRGDWTVTY